MKIIRIKGLLSEAPSSDVEYEELEQISKIPEIVDSLGKGELKVHDKAFEEMLILLRTHKIPFKPIQNGIEIYRRSFIRLLELLPEKRED